MIRTEYPHGNDFPIICVDNELCTARISLYGAHLMSWTPKGERDVLFMSPKLQVKQGSALRGGVPLCWPWFGKHPEDATQPSHGIARCALWTLASSEEGEDGRTRLILALPATDEMQPSAAFILELGAELVMSLVTLDVPHQMVLSAAHHSYFAVSDYEQIAITGLEEIPFVEYAPSPQPICEDPLIPAGNIDRIYHPVPEETDITIHDPAWSRSLRITRKGSHSCIIWNPGAEQAAAMSDLGAGNERGFIAVETTIAPAEQMSLAYGETHQMVTRVEVIKID